MENTTAGSISDIFDIINEKQQISFNELSDMSFSRGIDKEKLKRALTDLEKMKAIASRSRGGVLTYYPLQDQGSLSKVLIVEDDKNINKLMALSIGRGFEVSQIYDGGDAIAFVRTKKPDLVILDLMLPHKNGLDICRTIKSDPGVSNTIVILVSAMDPTENRFNGIKFGADYYIKKPFDPNELRSLVTIFLRKKGKRFDPLIDLPDEEGISNEIEHSIKEGEQYSIGTLKIGGLGEYAKRFGVNSAMVILRLISQLLQDTAKNNPNRIFVGFLDSEVFVIAGPKETVDVSVEKLREEFDAVLPFILQDEGYKAIPMDIGDLFDSKELPRPSLIYEQSEKDKIRERRNEILKSKGTSRKDIGSYTYEEIRQMFGNEDLDVRITRDSKGVKLQVSKDKGNEEDKR
ncbi:MAG: response regulator [Candidatus Micrarchaeota archaeon]|nr:response regulator [Candidatus Micrarchaeota archaeon]